MTREICPVCMGPWENYTRCNRGDCTDGRGRPLYVSEAGFDLAREGALKRDLAELLNRHGMDSRFGTPANVLAEFAVRAVLAWGDAVRVWRA